MKKLFKFLIAIFLGFSLVSCASEDGLSGVLVNKETLILEVGQQEQLEATVSAGELGNDVSVLWESSDEEVVSVTKNGLVTALKVGTAKVTVTASHGMTKKKDVCTIKVTPKHVAVEGVTLDKSIANIDVGDELVLTHSIIPNDATNQKVTWSSSDESVATVKNGVVKAIKVGHTTITVTTKEGNRIATCEVLVSRLVEEITLNEFNRTLEIGDSFELEATISPSDATNKIVVWVSSNPAVATVEDGLVSAISTGTAIITAATLDGLKTASCIVNVVNPVTGIELDVQELDLIVGDEALLVATVSPSDATNKNVTWASSDKTIATVNDGLVKAKAPGSVIITAITLDGMKTASCTINITQVVSNVKLDKNELEVEIGHTATLEATVSPSDATNKNITWMSSDESIVSVENGTITAHKLGSATVVVTTEDGNFKDICLVKVVRLVEKVSLDKSAHTLNINDEVQLVATVSPDDATNKDVIWTSSNESIATVENGLVKAISAGSATITVTTVEGNKKATCEITVITPVSGVELNITDTKVELGNELELVAKVLPEEATNKEVIWTSSNENVATVEDGVVSTIGAGHVTITVTTVEGNFEATCDIEVIISVTGVTLNEESTTLEVGDEFELIEIVAPSNATNKEVTWKSSNDDVVIVEDGVVTAVGAGNAIITVTTVDGEFEATCEFKVIILPTSIEIDGEEEITLVVNDTHELDFKILPTNATEVDVKWTSSDKSVVSVDEDGKLTANKAGVAIITVTSLATNLYDTIEVKVVQPVTGVKLPSTLSILAEDQLALTATISPSDASNKEVTWESANTAIATVDEDGVVTAVSVGQTTITVTTVDGGFKATCLVTVVPIPVPAESVEIEAENDLNTIRIDETLALEAIINPVDTTDPIAWSSNNETVAVVSANGVVTGLSEGKATIKVVVGSVEATYEVTVAKHSLEIENFIDLEVTYGNAYDFDPEINSNQEIEVKYYKEGLEISKPTDVGTYEVVAKALETAKYEEVTKTVLLEIIPLEVAEPTVKGTYTYNGLDQTVVLDGFNNKYMEIVSGNVGKNADTYTVTINLNSNYVWKNAEDGKLTWTINKAQVVKPLEDEEDFIYNGEEQTYELQTNKNYEIDGTLTKVNAGSNNILVILKDKDNYEWEDGSTTDLTFTFNIKKAKVEKPVKDEEDFIYNGEEQTYELETSDYYEITGTLTKVDAGSNDIIVSLKDVDNYEWEDGSTTDLTFTFNIKKLVVEVPEAVTGLVYNGKAQTGVEETEYYSVDNGTETFAGTHIAIVTLKNANLVWEKEFDGQIQWMIDKAEYDMSGIAWVYTEAFTYNNVVYTVEINASELPDGLSVDGYEGHVNTNVGKYTASVTLRNENPNYIDPAPIAPLNWEIVAREITVTIDSKEAEYRKPVELTYTLTGTLAQGHVDSDVFALTRAYGDNVGEYGISISQKNNNYVINYNKNAIYKIVPQELEKPVANTGLVYNGEEQVGVADGEGYYVIGGSNTNAGDSYVATVGLDSTTNYVWSDGTKDPVEVSYSIDKKKVDKPTLVDQKYTYNGEEQEALLEGVEGCMTITGNKATNAGTHTITVTLDENHKWSTNFKGTISWSIKLAVLTKPDVQDSYKTTYDGQPHSVTVDTTGVEIPVVAHYTYYKWLDEEKTQKEEIDGAPVNVGVYNIIVSYTSEDPNYGTNYAALTDNSRTITITQQALTIEWGDNESCVYDGTAKAPLTATITGGLVEGEDVSINVLGEQNPIKVGTYEYNVELSGLQKDNYYIKDKDLTNSFEIEKAELVLSMSDTSVTYDGNNHKLSATIESGKAVNDDVGLVITGPLSAIKVGTYEYTITLAGEDKDNYIWEEDILRTVIINSPTVTTRVENANEVVNGNYALAVEYDGKVYAIPNNISAFENNKIPFGSLIEHSEVSLSFNNETEKWTITKVGEYYYIHSGEQYLYGGSSTNITYGSYLENSAWTFANHASKGLYLQSTVATTRALLLHNNGTAIGHYASSNIKDSDSSYYVVKLYKLPSSQEVDLEISSSGDGDVTWTSTSGELEGLYTGIDKVTLTMVADENNTVKSVTLNEEPLEFILVGERTYECIINPVTEGGTINVVFGLEQEYHTVNKEVTNATITNVLGGNLLEEYEKDSTVSFKVVTDSEDYYVSEVRIEYNNTYEVLNDIDGVYSFEVGSYDVTIVATVLKKLTVTYEVGEHVSITVVDSNTNALESGSKVKVGESITYTITSELGYLLDQVNGEDANDAASVTKTITVNSDTNITATAKEMPLTSLVDAITLCESTGETLSTNQIKVSGIVKLIDGQLVTITDGENDFTIYGGVLGVNVTQYHIGDTVVAIGYYKNYNGNLPELASSPVYTSVTHKPYTISTSVLENEVESSNGEILIVGETTRHCGDTIEFGVDVKDGYLLVEVLVNEEVVTPNGDVYSFVLTENTTITLSIRLPIEIVFGRAATFSFGEDGEVGHTDSKTALTSYSESNNGYDLNINGNYIYANSKDEMGNSALKLGTGTYISTFEFTVPSNITEVKLYVAKYKNYATSVTVNEETTELTKASNYGEYDEIVVDTSTVKTVSFSSGTSGDKRCMIEAIEFYGNVEKIAAETVELQETLTLTPSGSAKLIYTIDPTNTTDIITWTSGNAGIVKVNHKGVVSAVSEGTTTVTLKLKTDKEGPEIIKECSVTVQKPALERIDLIPTEATLEIGDTLQFTATPYPTEADLGTIIWDSSFESVATVSSSGLVNAVGSGTTTITVSNESGTISSSIQVTVNAAPEVPVETKIATVDFESASGFTASTSYKSANEKKQGPSGNQWGVINGTTSTTDAISGSQSLQMRYYSDSVTPNVYMLYDVENVSRVTFNSANTNSNKVKVYYSLDNGNTWSSGTVYDLTEESKEYELLITEFTETLTNSVRLKFELVAPDSPTNTSRVYVDNVTFYGRAA